MGGLFYIAATKNKIGGFQQLTIFFFLVEGTMFGAVVVGIGIAGSVRIRDLLNPLQSSPSESLKLQGFVSRSVSLSLSVSKCVAGSLLD